MGCHVKTNRHGRLAFRLYWERLESGEGTELPDTPENRHLIEAQSVIIDAEIKARTFNYLRHFPNGNKAHLFRKEETRPATLYALRTLYGKWIKKQADRVRPHRVKEYKSHFERHILPARIEGEVFGRLHLQALTPDYLKGLQDVLRAKG